MICRLLPYTEELTIVAPEDWSTSPKCLNLIANAFLGQLWPLHQRLRERLLGPRQHSSYLFMLSNFIYNTDLWQSFSWSLTLGKKKVCPCGAAVPELHGGTACFCLGDWGKLILTRSSTPPANGTPPRSSGGLFLTSSCPEQVYRCDDIRNSPPHKTTRLVDWSQWGLVLCRVDVRIR